MRIVVGFTCTGFVLFARLFDDPCHELVECRWDCQTGAKNHQGLIELLLEGLIVSLVNPFLLQ